jgi:RNA polymerase sigma factor (TIGR02999 family)
MLLLEPLARVSRLDQEGERARIWFGQWALIDYSPPVSDVTRVLEAMHRGDLHAADELLQLVYQELRGIAAYKMAQEREGHTLQPTALVHEAWLRLTKNGNLNFDGRGHFFAVAAEAMRRILIESARRKRSLKRGGGATPLELDEAEVALDDRSEEMLGVDEALNLLAAKDPTAAELVKLRYFVGMPMAEAAATLGIPLRTAERLWTYAKASLRQHIG